MDTDKAKTAGQRAYEEDRAQQMADPEFRRVYDDEAAKKNLWLELVDTWQEAGLTSVQVAQRLGVTEETVKLIEKRGYDAYSVIALRRYRSRLLNRFTP